MLLFLLVQIKEFPNPFEVVKVAPPKNNVITLATATAAALTLSPKDAKYTCHVDGGMPLPGRRRNLALQFAQVGLQLIGLQERRCRVHRLRVCGDLHTFASAATSAT